MPSPVHAQSLQLPQPGTMVDLSQAYQPLMMKGLKVHTENSMQFDFLVSRGNYVMPERINRASRTSGSPTKTFGDDINHLIKYFLACLTIPEEDLWVNLSPYEKDRMIPKTLGQTELGRDLLAQDYILKQLTASLIYPEKNLGKEFWDRVYKKAQQLYGTAQIPVNTFNKVWILADTAKVFEHNDTAFVVSSHLKVMLDEDYLALNKRGQNKGGQLNSTVPISSIDKLSPSVNVLGSQIIRSLVLPAIEQEVNTGKNFAAIRQIFHAFILASWYKKNLREAILNKVYADKKKIKGLEYSNSVIASEAKQSLKSKKIASSPPYSLAGPRNDTSDVEAIYQQYLAAYKKGVFNYIKEDVDTPTGQPIPRKYFSGGTQLKDRAVIVTDRTQLNPQEVMELSKADYAVTVNLKPFNAAMSSQSIIETIKSSFGMRNFLERFGDKETINAFLGIPGLENRLAKRLEQITSHGDFLTNPKYVWKIEKGMPQNYTFRDLYLFPTAGQIDLSQELSSFARAAVVLKKEQYIQKAIDLILVIYFMSTHQYIFVASDLNENSPIMAHWFGERGWLRTLSPEAVEAWPYVRGNPSRIFDKFLMTVDFLIELLLENTANNKPIDPQTLAKAMSQNKKLKESVRNYLVLVDKIETRYNQWRQKQSQGDFKGRDDLLPLPIKRDTQRQQRIDLLQQALKISDAAMSAQTVPPVQAMSTQEKAERLAVAVRSLGHGNFFDLNPYSYAKISMNRIVEQNEVPALLDPRNNPALNTLCKEFYELLREMEMERYTVRFDPKFQKRLMEKIRQVYASVVAFVRYFSLADKHLNDSDKEWLSSIIHYTLRLQSRMGLADGVSSQKTFAIKDTEDLMTFVKGRLVIPEDLEIVHLRGNKYSFYSAINNLLTNGYQAAKQKYKGDASKIQARAFFERKDHRLIVRVIDNGPGLTPDQLGDDQSTGRQKIFNLDNTTKVGGTGLGTTEAWYAIKDMGGTIKASNRPEGGAEFTIELPISDAAMTTHGGIDLKTRDLKLDIQKQDSGIQINVDPAMIQEFQSWDFTGVVPVIIKITPINGAWSSFGLQPPEQTYLP